MEKSYMRIGFWWVTQKEIDKQEHIYVSGRITLRWILKK
jgi:hypothetical protein